MGIDKEDAPAGQLDEIPFAVAGIAGARREIETKDRLAHEVNRIRKNKAGLAFDASIGDE
jgi:hypothetical protein